MKNDTTPDNTQLNNIWDGIESHEYLTLETDYINSINWQTGLIIILGILLITTWVIILL